MQNAVIQALVKLAIAAGSHILRGSFRGKALLVLGFVVFSQFGIFHGEPVMVQTVAEVVDVRPYAKSQRPRIWLRYKFETKKGKPARGAARRYVKNIDVVSVGDLITIKYNRRRPSRTKVIALSVATAERSGDQAVPTSALQLKDWLPMLSTLAMMFVVGGLFFFLIRYMLPSLLLDGNSSEVMPQAGRRQASRRAAEPATRLDFERYRPKPVQTKARTKTKNSASKVKQRAGWFG